MENKGLTDSAKLCCLMNGLKADAVSAEKACRRELNPRVVGLLFQGLISQINDAWSLANRVDEASDD